MQMKEMVQWCLELGIACVSVYAFSIDNFRRPQQEVDALMELAAAKFEELLHVSGGAEGLAWCMGDACCCSSSSSGW